MNEVLLVGFISILASVLVWRLIVYTNNKMDKGLKKLQRAFKVGDRKK